MRYEFKSGILLLTGVVALILFTGCAFIPLHDADVVPPLGSIFVSARVPLTTDFNGNPCGAGVKKVSHSETQFFREPLFTLGLLDFAWDDVKLKEIAKKGGIEKISYADYEIMNILGIYACFTVYVYGN